MRLTLWAEGNGDVCLMPILAWLLRQNGVRDEVDANEFEHFFPRSTHKSVGSIFENEEYWSDILFVHQDADSDKEELGKGYKKRASDLNTLVDAARELNRNIPACVVVVPVQETETWLLVSEVAIQYAVSTNKPPSLPGRNHLESIGNPKARLCEIVRNLGHSIGTDEVDTGLWKKIVANMGKMEPQKFGVLRGIPSFDLLEKSMQKVIQDEGFHRR
jgi:hypothetical protein